MSLRSYALATTFLVAALTACAPKAETPAPAATTSAPATPAAPAMAPIPASESVRPFQIGALQAAALKDGGADIPNDGKTFAINKPPKDVSALLTAAGLPPGVVSVSVQPLLVKTGGATLLFDTGLGPANKGALPASLTAAGVKPEDVTDIFISHSHYDHVGGLATKDNTLAFPNAAIHMAAAEWAFMKGNKQQAALVATIAPKVATFEPGAELVAGVVTAVDIAGHTPGHSGYSVTSGGQSLLYIGDTMHNYVVSVQQPDWTVQYDSDPKTAQATRKGLLETAAASGKRIYAVHFPFPGIGKFEKSGDHFVWVAEK